MDTNIGGPATQRAFLGGMGLGTLALGTSRAVAGDIRPPRPSAPRDRALTRAFPQSLPVGESLYPAGPHAAAIHGHGLSCHSAGMVLTQPRLSRAEWPGEVDEMVKVVKATIDPADATLIVDDLAALETGR